MTKEIIRYRVISDSTVTGTQHKMIGRYGLFEQKEEAILYAQDEARSFMSEGGIFEVETPPVKNDQIFATSRWGTKEWAIETIHIPLTQEEARAAEIVRYRVVNDDTVTGLRPKLTGKLYTEESEASKAAMEAAWDFAYENGISDVKTPRAAGIGGRKISAKNRWGRKEWVIEPIYIQLTNQEVRNIGWSGCMTIREAVETAGGWKTAPSEPTSVHVGFCQLNGKPDETELDLYSCDKTKELKLLCESLCEEFETTPWSVLYIEDCGGLLNADEPDEESETKEEIPLTKEDMRSIIVSLVYEFSEGICDPDEFREQIWNCGISPAVAGILGLSEYADKPDEDEEE